MTFHSQRASDNDYGEIRRFVALFVHPGDLKGEFLKLARSTRRCLRDAKVQWERERRYHFGFTARIAPVLEAWGSELWLRVSTVEAIPLADLPALNKTQQLLEIQACMGGEQEAMKYFSAREKSEAGWTRAESLRRYAANAKLLAADPDSFSFAISISAEGALRVHDGGHRLAIARLKGESTVRSFLTAGVVTTNKSRLLAPIFKVLKKHEPPPPTARR